MLKIPCKGVGQQRFYLSPKPAETLIDGFGLVGLSGRKQTETPFSVRVNERPFSGVYFQNNPRLEAHVEFRGFKMVDGGFATRFESVRVCVLALPTHSL